MKKYYFALLVMGIYVGCQQSNTTSKSNLEQLRWLEGTWNRTNAGEGKSAHERWVRLEDNTWQGWGVTFKASYTSFVENIKIIEKDGSLFYVADIPENDEPVYFKFTSISEAGFVCENPTHDFPKKIEYQRKDDRLEATISGDGQSFPYLFERKK